MRKSWEEERTLPNSLPRRAPPLRAEAPNTSMPYLRKKGVTCYVVSCLKVQSLTRFQSEVLLEAHGREPHHSMYLQAYMLPASSIDINVLVVIHVTVVVFVIDIINLLVFLVLLLFLFLLLVTLLLWGSCLGA